MPKGQALGTVATMNAADNYGFVAETIGMFRVGSTAFPLTSTRGENFSVGTTGDLRLREYVVPTAGWDGSPTGQRKIGERKGDPSAPFFAHGRHPETVLHNGVFTTAAMLSNFLMIAGAAVLSVSLRSFRHPIMQKLGAIGVLATSFLFGYLLTENWVGGVACASIWLLLPWLELLTRIRRLTLPLERLLNHQSPPNSHRFPALGEITEEVEGESFEHVDDAGWEWDQTRQFFRLFYKADERAQAAICLVDQREVTFYYLSLSSRASDGTIWTTWNYPFSYSLKLVPQWRVNRLRGDQTFLQLLESHRSFLLRNGIAASTLEVLDAQRIPQEIQRDLRAQIAHNVSQGVLTETGSGEVRYSWRGLFFLWVQFLRDLVRIS